MRILQEKAIGVIIDIQERLFPHIYDHEALKRSQVILINGLKQLDVPMIMTEQYKKGLGNTIPEIREAMELGEGTEKMSFSCCDDEGFSEQLKQHDGRDHVILAGIETHVCVLQTAIDLLEKGYTPVVVEDCVSSRKLRDKDVAIERMRQEGARVTTYESLLFEICRYAGSDTFKSISKLVK